MKIIITGATGCIGRNLAERLNQDGFQIVATGRSRRIGAKLRAQGVEFRPADIQNPSQLSEVFEPAQCVIHCAGKSGDWGSARAFYGNNVEGTRNVVSACKHNGIERILFFSTPSVYYTGKDRFGIRESEPLPAKAATPYARTKLLAEQELSRYQREGGQVISFRPRAVHGPYDTTFVPRILRMAEKGKLPLINGGRALTDITHVDNLIDAVKRSLVASAEAWNTVYNISNGEPISVRDWFSQILAICDRPFQPQNIPEPVAKAVAGVMELASRLPFGPQQPLTTRFSVGYMARSMTMSLERARERLGYVPQLGNREGFERYAQWYGSSED